MHCIFKVSVIVAASIISQAGLADSSYKNEIPDFLQTDVSGITSGNGQQYCAPVAVSNSIVWLHKNDISQLEIINKLASRQYMNTSLINGTGTTGVLRGVERISSELFGTYKELKYEGWRKHPASYSSGVRVPDIEKIKSYISKKSAAWINIGWYAYEANKNEYRRIGGHWVTLVGSADGQLILHDPAPRAGKSFSNEIVEYSILKNGMLVGGKVGLPTPARGYIRLGRGMHVNSRADFAIVDGVVYFTI